MDGSVLMKKFMLSKRAITMEDCMMYIEQYHPDDKSWFFHLCTDEVEQTDKTGKTFIGVKPWGAVKAEFYKRYFPATAELSRRMKMLASWDIKD